MNDPTQTLTAHGRVMMAGLAKWLNNVTGGKLRPAHITTISLLGHIPAAWALWTCQPRLAAALIAVFAGLDALDGALARAQGSASRLGMFFDAVTDRLKEVIIYAALGVFLAEHHPEAGAWLAPALVGSSLLVSYVKAKGEMAIASGSNSDAQKLNRTFSGGLGRYEVRMVLLIIGLLVGDLLPGLLQLIVALNMFTAVGRFFAIAEVLKGREKKTTKKQKPRG